MMTTDAPEGGKPGHSRDLEPSQITALLKRGFWGVLATVAGDEPYGVPVIYGHDDDGSFYIANGPGKKVDVLKGNPNVTLTVVEVEDYGRRWESVIVYGRVEIVQDVTAKLHALNVLRKQIPRPSLRVTDAARAARATIVRIVPTKITGRAAG